MQLNGYMIQQTKKPGNQLLPENVHGIDTKVGVVVVVVVVVVTLFIIIIIIMTFI